MTPDLLPVQMFIDGVWVDSVGGSAFESTDPYFAKPWARVPDSDAEDVDRAIQAARRAFDDGPWRRTTGRDRARLMRRLAALVEQNADELVTAEVHDNGKVIREAAGQINA